MEKAFANHQMAPASYDEPKCPCCNGVLTIVDTSRTKLPPLIDFLVPKTLILDEAHALCNVKTRQSVAARRCARVADYTFPMSGTPITHDVGGFWSALNVLDIRSFPDQERYQERYTDRWQREYGKPEVEGLSTANKQEFFTLMQGSMRRVSRADVNADLPPKTYQTRAVDIQSAHRKAYDEMRDDMIAHIPDTDEPLPVMTTLTQLQRLSQLASSACDVEITYVLDDKIGSPTFGEEVAKYNVTMREPSWKIDALMELMDDNRGEPLICFSPHTQLVKLAGARAEKQGYKVGYIVGGQSQSARTAIRKRFNNGDLDLLCANVTAGGVGLTLTGTDTIVFLERPWAYWQADQSQSRADDVMNAKQVHIIDIVAKNTVESRVREALKSKAGSLAELVRDPRIVEELLGGQPLRV
jgi:SNF2 family DNA or RNA helicase